MIDHDADGCNTRCLPTGWLTRIRKITGETILFVTHDIEEATCLADRMIEVGESTADQSASCHVTPETLEWRHHRCERPVVAMCIVEFAQLP